MNELLIFVLATTLLIPVIMIVIGLIFGNRAPKKINHIYGYRTSLSMKNQNTWEFANKYCGKLWLKIGLIMFLLGIVIILLSFKMSENIMLCFTSFVITIQTIVVILSVFIVEKALREKFDENGEPRS